MPDRERPSGQPSERGKQNEYRSWEITVRDEDGETVYSAGWLPGEDQITVGRSSDCDIQLRYRTASREHCRLSLSNEEWRVEDLDSSNGIVVDGEKVMEAMFHERGSFRIGQWSVTVEPVVNKQEHSILPRSTTGRLATAAAVMLVVSGITWFLLSSGGYLSSGDKESGNTQSVESVSGDKKVEPVSPDRIRSLHENHKHRRAFELLKKAYPKYGDERKEEVNDLRDDVKSIRKHQKRMESEFRKLKETAGNAGDQPEEKRKDTYRQLVDRIRTFRETHRTFLQQHPELRTPSTNRGYLSATRKLLSRVRNEWKKMYEERLQEGREQVEDYVRKAYFKKALDQARKLRSITNGTPAQNEAEELFKSTRKQIETNLKKQLKKVKDRAQKESRERALSLVNLLKKQYSGTKYMKKIHRAEETVKNLDRRETAGKSDGDKEDDADDRGKRKKDSLRYRQLLETVQNHETKFRFQKAARTFREHRGEFHTEKYRTLRKTRIWVYGKLNRMFDRFIRWTNEEDDRIKKVSTGGRVLRPEKATREHFVVSAAGSTIEKPWAEMSDLSFFLQFLNVDELDDEDHFSLLLLRMERGNREKANARLITFVQNHLDFREETWRYIAMSREEEVPEGGYVAYNGIWLQKKMRKKLKKAEKKIKEQVTDIRWEIPEKGSALYVWPEKEHGFWLRGHSMKPHRPSAALLNNFRDVPVFLSMILPEKLVLNEPYEFQEQFDARRPLVPETVTVRGRWTGIEQVDGTLNLVFRNNIIIDKGGTKPSSEEGNGSPPRVLEGGRISATLYVDPERGVVSRLTFDASLSFNHLPKKQEKRTPVKGDYPVSAKYKLREFNRGEGEETAKKGSFQWKVNKAIEKGVKYLGKKQRKDGSWQYRHKRGYPAGETALTMLTLLEAGVDKESPVMKKAMNFLQKQEFQKTYTVAISIMAVERMFTPEEEHNKRGDYEPDRRDLSREAERWMIRAVAWLLKNMKKSGTWSYGKKDPEGKIGKKPVSTDKGSGVVLHRKDMGTGEKDSYDHSNTQYAILGLHAAARCGIFIHRKHWLQILNHWVENQEEEGPEVDLKIKGWNAGGGGKNESGVGPIQANARSWGYRKRGRTNNESMTAVGVASVKIARQNIRKLGELPKKLEKRSKQSLYDGLAWMQKNYQNYGLTKKPEPRDGYEDMYELYAVERAMMLNLIREIDGHRWYREGAKQLIELQSDDGSWGEKNARKRKGGPEDRDISETCFAILFLRRATIPGTGIATGK